MGLYEIRDPLRRLLPKLSLQLYLQNAIFEQLFVLCDQLLEWMIDPNIRSTPVLASAY
jgi:hypothetical protein